MTAHEFKKVRDHILWLYKINGYNEDNPRVIEAVKLFDEAANKLIDNALLTN